MSTDCWHPYRGADRRGRNREGGVQVGDILRDPTADDDELARRQARVEVALLQAVEALRIGVFPRFHAAVAREGGKPFAVGKILSRREQEVLAHVLAGKTSREIGGLIGLSARTVEFHRSNIMAKLGAANPAELVARARQLGVL